MILFSAVADARYALRTWQRSPTFVLVAALTIALGIGATTTIFSVANTLLLRTPTGVRNPEELISVFTALENGSPEGMFSYATFRDLSESETGLSELGALSLFTASLSTGLDAEPERVAGLAVSGNYFTILGTRPHLGRFFAVGEEGDLEPRPVTVLSFGAWKRRFGADSSIVGKSVNINRVSLTVIGVAEEGFQGHLTGYEFGVWVPLSMAGSVGSGHLLSELIGIGRIAPNFSFSRVAAAFAVANERLRERFPEEFETRSLVVSPYGGMIEFARKPVTLFLVLLFGISGIVLLIACVNVAGMLLSRASARSREIAIRLALGANREAVVRQLLTESTLLFLVGGGCGIALTFWTTQLLGTLRPPVPLPILIDFSPDIRVLMFTVLVAFVTGVVFGLAPALQVTRPDIVSSLKDEGGTAHGRRGVLRSVFVVAQVAGSAVLLVLAGVFARALSQADTVDLGFDPTNVHVYSIDVSLHHYSREEGEAFFRELHERAAALPGVESAALAWALPMGFDYMSSLFSVPGRQSADGTEMVQAGLNIVSHEYFETLGIGFLAGRGFSVSDREGTSLVVVVNQKAAELFWPGQNAVGKQLDGGGVIYEVVGVTTNGTYRMIGEEPRAMVYQACTQHYSSNASLAVRVVPGRAEIGRELAEIARSLDADLPAQTNAPYVDVIGLSLLPNRAAAATAGAFGFLGLVLAAVGLYGILSYAVSLRLREIGIRIALGADTASIRKLVLATGLRLTLIGLGIGLPIALGATLLSRSMLFGLSPLDPWSFASIFALFGVVGILSGFVPARRATRTDPIVALRCE
jgi:predicted permease